jgi:hypothetical protein
LRREARTYLGYFVWKITIIRQKIILFPILGGGVRRVRLLLDPPLLYTCILIVYMGAYFYACILMVCMGAIYMYIDGVYGCYIHVYWLCIWVLYTRILMVYISVIYMYIDCVYGCYIHVF